MKDMDMKGMPKMSDKGGQVHKGTGVVNRWIEEDAITLAHVPIQSMHWPAMKMSFKARDGKMIGELTRGGRWSSSSSSRARTMSSLR